MPIRVSKAVSLGSNMYWLPFLATERSKRSFDESVFPWFRGRMAKEFGWFDAECCGKSDDVYQRNVAFSVLDGIHVSAVQVAIEGELLLRHPSLMTQRSQSVSKLNLYFGCIGCISRFA